MQADDILPEVQKSNLISQVPQIKVVEDLKGLQIPDRLDEYRRRCQQALEEKRQSLSQVANSSQDKASQEKVNIELGQVVVSQEAMIPEAINQA